MRPWPLAVDPFTMADRLRIGAWLLDPRHQWTAGPQVRAYEQRWEKLTGAAHAIMVSNGSLANELIARRRKQELVDAGFWPKQNKVIFPACTWVSSVSPWIWLGFDPVWTDIGPSLCTSGDQIIKALDSDKQGGIGTVFYTSLMGQADDLDRLRIICKQRAVSLFLDNCEGAFSRTERSWWGPERHFCAGEISSTSFYFSHHTTTGTEGGMIFAQDQDAADWFRMMRNHGLTRGMPAKYRNPEADPLFDFHLLGTNARSSDLQAYMGSLVFDRSVAFIPERVRLARVFYGALDHNRFDDVNHFWRRIPLMALPIIPHGTVRTGEDNHKALLARLGIVSRPVVGGNLLRHTAFKAYGDARRFPIAQWVHDHGVYIGLHEEVTEEMVLELARALNAC